MQACAKVAGFQKAYKRLEKKIIVSGKSLSTLNNYMRCIAHVALHFNALPTQLDQEQIEDYLLHLKKKGASEADFKLTVFGLKFLFRTEGLDDQAIKLPSTKRDKKLPVVLSAAEVKALLKVPTLLKHRVLIGLFYGCGLRCHACVPCSSKMWTSIGI